MRSQHKTSDEQAGHAKSGYHRDLYLVLDPNKSSLATQRERHHHWKRKNLKNNLETLLMSLTNILCKHAHWSMSISISD